MKKLLAELLVIALLVMPGYAIAGTDYEHGDSSVICETHSNDKYGGINHGADHPPNGTSIDADLTKENGRLTATGICGTYQYVGGWWFNESEMAVLPLESQMYGESPYAAGVRHKYAAEAPVAPVPEVQGIALVISGILVLAIWRVRIRTRK